jgi:hypothetical protein
MLQQETVRKLSTHDALIFDREKNNIFVVKPTSEEIFTSSHPIFIAEELVKDGRGICLDSTQISTLWNKTKDILMLD